MDFNDIALLFLGAGLGLILSFLFWLLTNHFLVSKLVFSEHLAKSAANQNISGLKHQFAIKNIGNRSAIDVQLRARIRIFDIKRSGGKLWDTYDLTIRGNHLMRFKNNTMLRYSIHTHLTERFDRKIFGDDINKLRAERTLTLDHFFEKYERVEVYIEALATDRFSGARKYFTSKRLKEEDVVTGVFVKRKLKPVPKPIAEIAQNH